MNNGLDNAQQPDSVPFTVHENEMMRAEIHMKRLWIALIVAIAACVAITAGFLIYFNQYDFAEYDFTQDGKGINIIGDSNGVDYGGPAFESEGAYKEEP